MAKAARTILVIGLMGVAGGVAYKYRPRTRVEVQVAEVGRGDVRRVVSSASAGEVVPGKRATVRAELPGRVTHVLFRRGAEVKAGQVVVKVDTSEADARAKQARASRESGSASLVQAEARAQSARRARTRQKGLFDKGAIPSAALEAVDDEAQLAEAGVRGAKANLRQLEAQVKLAEVGQAKAEYAAPFDGILVQVAPEVGDELVMGAPVFEIIDNVPPHVEATVDEADSGRVAAGQPVEITLDAFPGKTFHGKVREVGPAVIRDPRQSRTLPVTVDIDEESRHTGLKVGMSANVEIIVEIRKNVVYVQSNVVIGRGRERAVFLAVGGQGEQPPRAERRKITTGVGDFERTEVVDGLSPGDRVVASLGAAGLADGAELKIVARQAGEPARTR